MNKKTPVKRFIAGAVCPKCGEMDKIITYVQDDETYRECVSCGFQEKQNFQYKQRELNTRVNQSDEKIHSDTQVLQFPPKS